VSLPKRDGFAVLREVSRSGLDTPVIVLTARAQEADKVFGVKLGAHDYLTKPFSPIELCARIEAVLHRTAAPGVAENCEFAISSSPWLGGP
jgi:DNA-binding response OmpR family regulator